MKTTHASSNLRVASTLSRVENSTFLSPRSEQREPQTNTNSNPADSSADYTNYITIKCSTLNARSILSNPSKLPYLLNDLASNESDIYGVTETWLGQPFQT